MTCPYCHAEMEVGLIQNGQVIYWRPGLKKRMGIFNDSALQEGAILLPGSSFLFGSRVKSYLCRSCNKIIIDCNESESEPEETTFLS